MTPGKALHETYTKENLEILKEGCKNLAKHIDNARKFGIKVICWRESFCVCGPSERYLGLC